MSAFVVCRECGRIVKAFVPRGGDGTGVRPHAHQDDGSVCSGTYDLHDDFYANVEDVP